MKRKERGYMYQKNKGAPEGDGELARLGLLALVAVVERQQLAHGLRILLLVHSSPNTKAL